MGGLFSQEQKQQLINEAINNTDEEPESNQVLHPADPLDQVANILGKAMTKAPVADNGFQASQAPQLEKGQIIVGEQLEQQLSNSRKVSIQDLKSIISERAATDTGKKLKIQETGRLKLTSNILDIRFNRAKQKMQVIRQLVDTVESQLLWVVKKQQNCIEFTLSDIQSADSKLKNKINFYTTLSGVFIGVKPGNLRKAVSSSTYYEQLEAETRRLWEGLHPQRTENLQKEHGMLKYEESSSLGEEELTKIFQKKQFRLIGSRNDDWEVESDEQSKRKRRNRNPQKVQKLLSSNVTLESYFEKQANWPIFVSYVMVHEVILPTADGVIADFHQSIFLIGVEPAADKLTQSSKDFISLKKGEQITQTEPYVQRILQDNNFVRALRESGILVQT